MTSIVTPDSTLVGVSNSKQQAPESKEIEIPTDKEGIKKYLEVIPKPVGYRMLVRLYAGPKKTKGGLILTDTVSETIQTTTVVGLVVALGDLCYKDKTKFPNGPWCKERQFVIYGRYAGSRLPIEGGEVRLLNDDEVLGTIENPESVLHHI